MTVRGQPLPFEEAVDFLRQKVRLPSRAWTDLKQAAHARGFVVAGATVDALLADFHAAVIRTAAEGRTLADFRRDFDTIVARHGWTYRGKRGWRSAVIYNTTMRMAFQAGKWAQARRIGTARAAKGETVYLRYSAVLDGSTRDEHRAWHGIVLPQDHPWWATHAPPNGWGCRCSIEILTKADLGRRGLAPTRDEDLPPAEPEPRTVNTPFGPEDWPTPPGIDTGFGYNVGEAWLSGAVPAPLQHPLPPPGMPGPAHTLPPLTPHPPDPARLLPRGLKEEEYVDRFLAEFGAARGLPAPFRDVSGTLLALGEELFLDRRTGGWKAAKNGREVYLLTLADALKDPDEIWLDWFPGGGGRWVLRRRYLRAITLPNGAGALTSFQWTAAGWEGRTVFPPETASYLAGQRKGVLLWKRR